MDETKRNSLRQLVRTPYSLVALSHLLLLLSPSKTKAAKSEKISLPGCPDSCGQVAIPYPFGIGLNCSMSEDFVVFCDATNGELFFNNKNGTKPTPYTEDLSILILNISISSGQVRVNGPIFSRCYNNVTERVSRRSFSFELDGTPYVFNHDKNNFMVIGCDTVAYVDFTRIGKHSINEAGCISRCDGLEDLTNGSCSGIGCCQTSLPKGTNAIYVNFDGRYNNSRVYDFNHCGYALLTTEDDEFEFNTLYITTDELNAKTTTVLLDWTIGNTTCDVAETNLTSFVCKSENSNCSNSTDGFGYLCKCKDGYEGNPYLEKGCQDIDECANQNSCSNPAKCHNTQGGYYCSCPLGWRSTRNDFRQCELNVVPVVTVKWR
ncbi:hypothetical protein LUZ61_019905 [Rhynchospora tenuis]|uniref:EGF-like domain-containing protein n=1 Tax=Rhynchospora tenuis TaxID=198213 RepID=A0AAD5ZC86_9POAL|nr:hypothetical protein LUZ61_019905 [Rhynchospora tenuis]